MEGSGDARPRRDVEMQNIFANSQFRIRRYGRTVFAVCLDKDHMGAALGGHLSKFGIERRGDTLSPVRLE